MKINLATCLCSFALAMTALGQDPTNNPAAPSATPAATVAAATPTVAPTASPKLEEDSLAQRIERKAKKKGISITFDEDEDKDRSDRRDRDEFHISDGDDSWLAIPIVGVVFLTIFGTPVMIVGLIMYFSMSKTRAMHRTVRMMVEKGQEVPAALLNPSPAVRQRSDMRRGIVLVMVGVGLMVFFAAVNDWEGGAWALGIIPFLIGCGYLLVWRLEGSKANGFNTITDNPPPLP